MRSLTTYVLLEQEAWFEPEMSLLPLLLEPGMNVLDIGANHGIYALEMARLIGHGHVWAFEPTSEPLHRLRCSVRANGVQDRVTVVGAALSECDGEASFAVQDNSELNSRSGFGERRETVRTLALDGYLARHAPAVTIDFVKLDAEGDELRVLAGAQAFLQTQSPTVMFEFKHGLSSNDGLVQAWRSLGFEIFRWSAELALLLPFDPATGEVAFALNLFAIRPDRQRLLEQRGLLVTAGQLAAEPALEAGTSGLDWLCAQPAMRALASASFAEPGGVYERSLRAVCAVHGDAARPPAQRAALLVDARQSLLDAIEAGAQLAPQAWALLVHILLALGEQQAAVAMARRLLQEWPAQAAVDEPFMPPLRSDLGRACTVSGASWLRQMLGEFEQRYSAFSSYFSRSTVPRCAQLLEHPDHGAEIERRYLLMHVLAGMAAPVQRLTLLADPSATENGPVWRGLIDSMRLSAPATPEPPRTGPMAVAMLLAALPVAPVEVVDVGASSLGKGTEPYAALVQAGHAKVTGFEPDEGERRKLCAEADDSVHRYLPNFVGNGKDGVFRETEWPLTASLLEPDRSVLDRFHMLGDLVRVKARLQVSTVRLDDVIPPGGMKLLKIDVQGAEAMVFDGAPRRLGECLMVWTEVEFLPLYSGQPLFGDIDQQLRGHGLQFWCFAGIAHRPLTTWPAAGVRAQQVLQQLWSDAVYVPSPERIRNLASDDAAQLALLSHYVLHAYDLCHEALCRYDEVAGTCFAPNYLSLMGG
jgi:protein O-GlcNAc transferase